MRILPLLVAIGLAMPTWADEVRLQENAPDRHVVVKGDTLWDISATFLKDPWKWPDVWRLNKDEIENPHLIYPGDVILLVQTPDGPRLMKMGTVRLSPEVQYEPIETKSAIPTIPYAAVKGFMGRTSVVDSDGLHRTPKIIASEDGRDMLTRGDRVYARGIDGDQEYWYIVRSGKMLKDPVSGKNLAREVEVVGTAKLLVKGHPATLEITEASNEVSIKDLLIPATEDVKLDFMPRSPEKKIEGRIIAASGGKRLAGKYSNVVINKGSQDGLSEGHVLSIFREGRTVGIKSRTFKEVKDTSTEEQVGLMAGLLPIWEDDTPKRDGFIDASQERAKHVEYANFGEEFLDFIDPFDFFFKPYPDGRRGWRYMDTKCIKPGAKINADGFYDPADVMGECSMEKNQQAWAYMDIGCLKPGKHITYGESFDPKEVYEPHCRPEAPVKLPDVAAGHVLIYKVFDRVSYGLVMDSPGTIYLLDIVRNP